MYCRARARTSWSIVLERYFLFLLVHLNDSFVCQFVRLLGTYLSISLSHGMQEAPDVGELKRLYVNEQWRGWGIGSVLAKHAIRASCHQLGYNKLYLDSLERLPAAVNLYKGLGFRPCEAYIYNPMPDAVFMAAERAQLSNSISSSNLS